MINNLSELEAAVQRLSPEQLARFRRWFDEYDSDAWDSQIERDIQAGKLDGLAREAREQYAAGRCSIQVHHIRRCRRGDSHIGSIDLR